MDHEANDMLQEILSTVKNLEQRISLIEDGASSTNIVTMERPTVSAKKMSIKEFLIQVSPTNGVQTTLAIAYYMEKYDGVSPINAADIEKGFRAAKEPVPSNINDKTNMCVKNGHLMEAEEKKDSMKAWIVTRSGEQVAEKGFSKEK